MDFTNLDKVVGNSASPTGGGSTNVATAPQPAPQSTPQIGTGASTLSPLPTGQAPGQATQTQNFNGQAIPASIPTKNLVSYDAKTGNKTFKLPDFVGGGVYTEDAQNRLVNTGHSSYGGEPAVAGQERDDIIPVSLGGTNANAQNIKDVPLGIADAQDVKEKQMAQAVKSGQIAPHAAIAQILSEKANLAGAPSQSWIQNFLPALKDVLGNAVVQPAVSEFGVTPYNLVEQGKSLVQQGALSHPNQEYNVPSETQTRNLPLGIGQVQGEDTSTVGGNLKAANDAFNTLGLASAAANPIETAEGIGSAFKSVGTGLAEKAGLTGGEEAATTAAKAGETVAETPKTETPKSLKDVTPEYNGKTMDASDKITNAKGETQYRLNAPKMFGSTAVNSSASEYASAQEVDKLPDYSKAKTFTDKAQVVDTGISNEAEQMRGGLQAEDKASPLNAETEKTKMIQATHDALPEDMQAKVDAGKPLPNTKAGQYYQATLDNANSYDGTREGKLDVRQDNDKAYLSARGKLAFGDNDLNALDDSNKGLRNSINKDLANTSQTDTSNSLNKQSKLYDARDVLNDKAKTEATFKGRHPLVSKLGTREVMSATTGALAGGLLGGSFTTAGKNAVNAVKGEVNKLRGINNAKSVKPKAPKAPPKPSKR